MKSEMENNEWLNEAILLKRISTANPFTVPPGYFDELEQKITAYVHINETTDAGFAVPENYFDNLSGNIQSRINIEELINANNEGHTVPDGYFGQLQQQINARVALQEALEESVENFRVPEGYFNKLNKDILNKTVNQDMVRRKGVVRKLWASGAFKYAAAACFALVIGTTIFLNGITPPAAEHKNSYLHKQVSTISVSDIQTYLQQDVDANDTQHAVIDEGAPVNDSGLNNALQGYNDTNQ